MNGNPHADTTQSNDDHSIAKLAKFIESCGGTADMLEGWVAKPYARQLMGTSTGNSLDWATSPSRSCASVWMCSSSLPVKPWEGSRLVGLPVIMV